MIKYLSRSAMMLRHQSKKSVHLLGKIQYVLDKVIVLQIQIMLMMSVGVLIQMHLHPTQRLDGMHFLKNLVRKIFGLAMELKRFVRILIIRGQLKTKILLKIIIQHIVEEFLSLNVLLMGIVQMCQVILVITTMKQILYVQN